MQPVVLVEIARQLLARDDLAHAKDDGLEPGRVGLRRKHRRTPHALDLKRAAYHETFLGRATGDATDIGAGMRHDHHKPFLREALHRLAHRRARHVPRRTELTLDDRRPRRPLEHDNRAAEQVIYLIGFLGRPGLHGRPL